MNSTLGRDVSAHTPGRPCHGLCLSGRTPNMVDQNRRVFCILEGKGDSPDQEEIVELAFQFWQARAFRNCSPKSALLRAVREVRSGSAGIRASSTVRAVPETGNVVFIR